MSTKKSIFFSVFAAGAFLFASCGSKISEETKKEITEFEAEWGQAAATAEELRQQLEKEEADWKERSAHMHTSDSLKKVAKATTLFTLDSLETACKKHGETFSSMKTALESFKTRWDEDSKTWTEWRVKVEKGHIGEPEVKREMAKWNEKLAEAQADLSDWQTSLKATSDQCIALCEAHKKEVANSSTKPVRRR